jgi:hypothetical protein
MSGEPPYFKINDDFVGYYDVVSKSSDTVDIALDKPPRNYLVGENIQFSFAMEHFPIPERLRIPERIFWDFGDGTKTTGLQAEHSYTKPRSYLLKVTFLNEANKIELLDSVMLQILPDKNYRLPKPYIAVNGIVRSNSLTDVLSVSFTKPIKFDASLSEQGSSKIATYFWDFGDGKTSDKTVTYHSYEKSAKMFFPFLRLIDENGFIVDSFVQLNNDYYPNPGRKIPEGKAPSLLQYMPIGIVVGSIIVVFFLLAVLVMYVQRQKAQ